VKSMQYLGRNLDSIVEKNRPLVYVAELISGGSAGKTGKTAIAKGGRTWQK
jgi:hypothetical protein